MPHNVEIAYPVGRSGVLASTVASDARMHILGGEVLDGCFQRGQKARCDQVANTLYHEGHEEYEGNDEEKGVEHTWDFLQAMRSVATRIESAN